MRTWGTKHVLQLTDEKDGPRAVDLDDHQAPTSLELGPLESKPKIVVKNCSFLSRGWRGREQCSHP